MCVCFLELLSSILKDDYFLLYLQELEGKGQRKDGHIPGRDFSSQPNSKGKVSVFYTLAAAAASEISKGLMPWRRVRVPSQLYAGV